MKLTLPPAEVLYRLAMKAEIMRRREFKSFGPNTIADKLEHIRNGYLIANEGREIK